MICSYLADREKMQPYFYIKSEDLLLRSKEGIKYRDSGSGMAEAVGCLFLYFILRHKKMFSVENVKKVCENLDRDVKCGWKEAVSSSGDRSRVTAVKLQKLPKMRQESKGTPNSVVQ